MEFVVSSQKEYLGNELRVKVNSENCVKKKKNLLIVSNHNARIFPSDFFTNDNNKANSYNNSPLSYYRKETPRNNNHIIDEKDLEDDKELLNFLSDKKRKPNSTKNLSPMTLNKTKNIYDLKSTGLNQIPEEDEDKLRTLYNSSKKFFENKQSSRVSEESNGSNILHNKLKNIRIPRDRSAESFSTTNDSVKKIKEEEKGFIKVKRPVFDYSKRSNNNSKSPVNNVREELRTERNNSINQRRIETADHIKLPTISTNRGKSDLSNILNEANELKEDPIIKKKLNDIFQNIEDIKKVLDQKTKKRMKIASAPVGSCDTNLDLPIKKNVLPNFKLGNKILNKKEKDKFPVKIIKL